MMIRGPYVKPQTRQKERVLIALQRGAQDYTSIAGIGQVPVLHVAPLLARLRKAGLVKGWSLTANGRKALEKA